MRTERLLPVVTLAVASTYLYFTEQIGEMGVGLPISGKVFPRVLSAALAIAAVLWFVEILRAERTREPALSVPAATGDGQGHWWLIVVIIAWTAALYGVFQSLGYVLATTAYLLPLMVYFNRGRWFANIATAVLFSVISYYLFADLLGVPLPVGLLNVF